MTQGTGSRHCTVSSREHKVDGCSITARLSPPMDLSSRNKPSPGPEVSTLIPRGATRERTYNCRRTRSQGRRPGSLPVSTRPGAEAAIPSPAPRVALRPSLHQQYQQQDWSSRGKQLPLDVSNTRSSSHSGQPERVSPDTFFWPQPETAGFA